MNAGRELAASAPPTALDARASVEPALAFAGKTGTAQVKRITERERDMGITQAQLPWHLRHHALFVCYGPVDNPRYACAVIVEHGMAGGATAGPIGRDVLVETMKRDPSRRTDRFRQDGVAMSLARCSSARSTRRRRSASPRRSGASTGAWCWC